MILRKKCLDCTKNAENNKKSLGKYEKTKLGIHRMGRMCYNTTCD